MSRTDNNAPKKRNISRVIIITVLLFILLSSTAAALWYLQTRSDSSEPAQTKQLPNRVDLNPDEVLAKAAAFYESRPLYERPHPYTEIPVGLPDLRAATCGACHTEIYKEWQLSTHRRAWLDDAQFMEELAKSRGAHNESDEQNDVGWMCVNCHTPLVNQLPELVIGLENDDISKPIYAKNPSFDPVLQLDAITCATCHVQNGIVYGPFGDTDAPHPVAKGDYLLTEENCIRCHQAEAIFPAQNLGCFFTTGQEWKDGPYAETNQTCQSCHMPEVTRRLAPAYDRPERVTRRHWFGGSLIPKHPDYEAEIAPLREVYGSGAEIELIALPLDTEKESEKDAEQETIRVAVRITNANAGHLFPTGDPERHVDITATARTADGTQLAKSELRLGSVYSWWPEIKLESDNRIAPRQYRDLILEIPANGQPFTVEIEGDKYRMYLPAFEHHKLEGRYVRGRRFHRSTWNVTASGEPSMTSLEDDQHP